MIFSPLTRSCRGAGIALAVTGALLGLAACGEEESPFTRTTGPTKAQLIADADLICQRAEAQVRRETARALEGVGRRSLTDAELAEIAEETVIPIAEEQLARLRELPRPEEDRELLERIFAAAERDLAELRREPSSIEQPEAVFAGASGLAADYGFQECADAG
ncbi:MAG TPA: hypothetical protein VGR10_08205 [Thermoleophilaceae bacterium]|nr:hypothetical protein [Thermoleophilaceae bacterium]